MPGKRFFSRTKMKSVGHKRKYALSTRSFDGSTLGFTCTKPLLPLFLKTPSNTVYTTISKTLPSNTVLNELKVNSIQMVSDPSQEHALRKYHQSGKKSSTKQISKLQLRASMLRGSALPLNKRIPLSYTISYRTARSPADNRKIESTKSNTQPVYGTDNSKSISIERTTESTNEEPYSTSQYTSIPSSLPSLTKTSAKSFESPVGTSINQTEPLPEYRKKYIPSNPTRSEPPMDSNEKHDQTSSTPVSMIAPSNLPPSTSSDTPSIPETVPKSTESRVGSLTNQTEMLSETPGQNTTSTPTQSEHPMETEEYDQTSTSIPVSTIAQNNILPSTSSETPSVAETPARTAGSPNLTSTAQTERTTISSEPPGKDTFASLEKSSINEPSTIYSLVSTYGSSSATGTMSEPFREYTERPDLASVFETQSAMQSTEYSASNPTYKPPINEPSTHRYPSDTSTMSEPFGESTEIPDLDSVFETQSAMHSMESPASNPTDTPSINEPESTDGYSSDTGMMSEPFGESTEIPDLDSVFETQSAMQSMESPASNPTDTPSINEPSTHRYPSDTSTMSEPFAEYTERPDLASVFETLSTIQSTESSINEPSTIYSSESTYGSPLDTDTMSEPFGESTKYRDLESILTARPTGQLTESTALDRSSTHESLSTNLLKAHSTGRGPTTFQFNYSPVISEPLKSEIQPTEKLDHKTTSTIPTLLTQTKPPASTFSDAQSITKTLAKSTERTVDTSKKQAEGTNPLSKLTGKSTAGTSTISKPQEKESKAHDLTSIFTTQTMKIPSKTLTSAPSRSPSKGETSTKFTELSVQKSTKKIERSTQELTGKGTAGTPTKSKPLEKESETHDLISISTKKAPSKPHPSIPSGSPSSSKTSVKSTESPVLKSTWSKKPTISLSKSPGKASMGTPKNSEPKFESTEIRPLTFDSLTQLAIHSTISGLTSDTPSMAETSAKSIESPVRQSTLDTETTISRSETSGISTSDADEISERFEKSKEYPDRAFGLETQATVQLTGYLERNPTDTLSIFDASTINSLDHSRISPAGTGILSEPFGESTDSPDRDSVFETPPTIQLAVYPASNHSETSSLYKPSTIYSLDYSGVYPTVASSEGFKETKESPDRASVFKTEPTMQLTVHPTSKSSDKMPMYEPEYSLDYSGISRADADAVAISEPFGESTDSPYRASAKPTIKLTVYPGSNPSATPSIYRPSTEYSLDYSDISPADADATSEPFEEFTESPDRVFVLETQATVQLTGYAESNPSDTLSIFDASPINSLDHSGLSSADADAVSKPFWESTESPDLASVFKMQSTIKLTVYPSIYKPSTEYSLDYSGIPPADADAISEPRKEESKESPDRASALETPPTIELTGYPERKPSDTPSIYKPSTIYSLDYSDISPTVAMSEGFMETKESPDRASIFKTEPTMQLTVHPTTNSSDTVSIYEPSMEYLMDYTGISPADPGAISEPFEEFTESPDRASVLETQPTIKITGYPEINPPFAPSVYKPSTETSLDYSGVSLADLDADAIAKPFETFTNSSDRDFVLDTQPTTHPTSNSSDKLSMDEPSMINSLDYSGRSSADADSISEILLDSAESPNREPMVQSKKYTDIIEITNRLFVIDDLLIADTTKSGFLTTRSNIYLSTSEEKRTKPVSSFTTIAHPKDGESGQPASEDGEPGPPPEDAKSGEPSTGSEKTTRGQPPGLFTSIKPLEDGQSIDPLPEDGQSGEPLPEDVQSGGPGGATPEDGQPWGQPPGLFTSIKPSQDGQSGESQPEDGQSGGPGGATPEDGQPWGQPPGLYTSIKPSQDGQSGESQPEDGQSGEPLPEDGQSGGPGGATPEDGQPWGQPPGLFTSIKPSQDGQSGESQPEDGQSGGPGGATPEDGQPWGQPPGLYTSIKPSQDGQSGESQPEDGQSGEPLPEDGQSGGPGGATPEDGQPWGQPPGLFTSIKPSQDGQSGESQPEDGQSGEPLPEDGQSGGPGGATPEDGQPWGQPPGLFTSIKPPEDGKSGGPPPGSGQPGRQPPLTKIDLPEDLQSGEQPPEEGQSGEPLPEKGQSAGPGGAPPEYGQSGGPPQGLFSSLKPPGDGQSGGIPPGSGQSAGPPPGSGQPGRQPPLTKIDLPEDGPSGLPGGAAPEDGQPGASPPEDVQSGGQPPENGQSGGPGGATREDAQPGGSPPESFTTIEPPEDGQSGGQPPGSGQPGGQPPGLFTTIEPPVAGQTGESPPVSVAATETGIFVSDLMNLLSTSEGKHSKPDSLEISLTTIGSPEDGQPGQPGASPSIAVDPTERGIRTSDVFQLLTTSEERGTTRESSLESSFTTSEPPEDGKPGGHAPGGGPPGGSPLETTTAEISTQMQSTIKPYLNYGATNRYKIRPPLRICYDVKYRHKRTYINSIRLDFCLNDYIISAQCQKKNRRFMVPKRCSIL